jgi:GAF domain-containing protein
MIMDTTPLAPAAPASHPLSRFRKASQAVHATQVLDEVLARTITEVYSALDAEAASVALLDRESGQIILYGTGPVAERISGLQLPAQCGIIGWVIANGKSAIVNDAPSDARFWPEVDGYTGFGTQSVLSAPLLSGNQVIGALEVLNKRKAAFTNEDLNFLEAFGAVAASAIESAQRFRQEQQRRREVEALRHAWEALTTPHSLEELLEVILDQLRELIEYRSAAILLITEEGGLELGTSRGMEDLELTARIVSELGVDVKVRTMLETRQPILITDTATDTRWQHFPGRPYVRSWIGAPLLIKGHLIGTLNVDHDQPGFYSADHVQLVTNFTHQAAIAIENSRLYAATHEAALQLTEQARRMVTLYETSRTLLRGLELDQNALYALISRVSDLIGARYGLLNILAENGQSDLFIAVTASDCDIASLDRAALENSILGLLSSEHEVVRNGELQGSLEAGSSLPPAVLSSFLGVAIHARGRLLGQLLLADKRGDRDFSQDDQALALALAANLASAVENALLYHKTHQRVRELTALHEISHTLTATKETREVYSQLATQVGKLLDAERCAYFIYRDGILKCQAPGYGLEPDIIPLLTFPVTEDNPLYALIHTPDPLISNEVMQDPDLAAYRPLLTQLNIHRLLSCRIYVDEQEIGLVLAANKRGGEEFSEQDRHLVSIIAHQVSNVLQRALLQNRQREHAQIQSALLQVSQAISSLTDMDDLLKTVAQVTHQLAACDHCLIASWEERHSAFIPRAQSGCDPELYKTLSEIHLRPAEMRFIDEATETRQPVLLMSRDITEGVPDSMRGLLGSEYSWIVPLVTQKQVVGLIIAAYTRGSRPPGKREIALVTGIARQAAIAIENANLYQDIELHATRLERAYRDLKELDERRAEIVQNVTHEIRTPFTLIKGYLELLLKGEMGTLSERQKEGLSIIAEKTEALGKLILDIVTVQSFDTQSLDLLEFDPGILIRNTMAGQKLDVAGLRLQCDLPPDLPYVRADPNLVKRVLELLLDNAIKFSPGGGIITLRARPKGAMMHIEVEDQGIGIPEEALPYVFDHFYQADASTTRRFGGAGLGLSIVEQIVTAHGGQVGVHSTEGTGSTFHFTLPLTSPPNATVP